MSVRHRRPLLACAVLVVGAGLGSTACGPDNADPAAAPTAGATVAATPPTAGAPASATASHPATGAPQTPGANPSGGPASGGTASGGAGAGSAAARPCDIKNLTVQAAARAGAPHQWVIEVRNTGAAACTLSSSPGVDLGDSAAADRSRNIKPVLASGTARFPVPAGRSAYAVIDLDPSGATTGTAPGVNELNVLADQDDANMPLADTSNVPLPGGVHVLNPRMGLYRADVAQAVASMTTAGK
ncbi:DUF4232 domain-containing protein [Kitasatospora sp. NPDC001539]|uniref:DUF4232 domain-containing protein n=1 Tax=Kitasatospora sp. NPDC001539 TaxID=3154384 RepID=UPI00332937A0